MENKKRLTVLQASNIYWKLAVERDAAYEDYCKYPNDKTWEEYCEAVDDVGAFLAHVESLGLNVVEVTLI